MQYLYKTHANGAHFGKLVNSLKSVVNRLGQQLGELLVVEDLEAAATRDLTDRSWMEAMVVVTVTALHKDAAVTQTLSVHLSTHIIQVHACREISKDITMNTSQCQICFASLTVWSWSFVFITHTTVVYRVKRTLVNDYDNYGI